MDYKSTSLKSKIINLDQRGSRSEDPNGTENNHSQIIEDYS
jgi:hypothetical protein